MKVTTKQKKILKIIAFLVATTLTLGVVFFAHAFLGNPVSKYICTKSAEKYLAQTYGETDFVLEEVNYNFKTGGYYAHISSPSSADSHFSLDFSLFGALQRDYYHYVSDGWNTLMRCEDGYRELVQSVLSAPDFPYISELDFGSFISSDDKFRNLQGSFVLDQEFDYEGLGKEYGELVYYAQVEEITLEKMCEVLLGIKGIFDEKEVYFCRISLCLEKPYIDGYKNFEGETLRIENFLSEDIYEEGLLERVTKAKEEYDVYVEEEEKMADVEGEMLDS
ncbi:MAG: hypothetical protein R3Y07_07960 [Eubacteriales bacterium]